MKKFFTILGLASCPLLMNAQQFTIEHDTAYLYTSGNDDDFVTVYNHMDNATNDDYTYSWRFLNTEDLPATWSFNGFCDNIACRPPSAFSWGTGGTAEGVPLPGRAINTDLKLQLDIPTAAPSTTVIFKLEVKSPSQTDTVYYYVSKHPLSVDKIPLNDNRFQLYPNPSMNNELNIQSNVKLGIERIVVSNLIGQEIMSVNVNNNETTKLDVSALQSGLYILQGYTKDNKNIVTRKFSKN